jgi:hypothetical protein
LPALLYHALLPQQVSAFECDAHLADDREGGTIPVAEWPKYVNNAITTYDFCQMGLSYSYNTDGSFARSILRVSDVWEGSTSFLPPFEEVDESEDEYCTTVCRKEIDHTLNTSESLKNISFIESCEKCERTYYAGWKKYTVYVLRVIYTMCVCAKCACVVQHVDVELHLPFPPLSLLITLQCICAHI